MNFGGENSPKHSVFTIEKKNGLTQPSIHAHIPCEVQLYLQFFGSMS